MDIETKFTLFFQSVFLVTADIGKIVDIACNASCMCIHLTYVSTLIITVYRWMWIVEMGETLRIKGYTCITNTIYL